MTISPTALRQIGLLTDDHELPQPAIPRRIMCVVARCLQAAVDRLHSEWAEIFGEPEPQINAAMESVLIQRLQEAGSSNQLHDVVLNVTRGAERFGLDGRPEKRPDLGLWLVRRHFPLLVECKLLDRPSKTIANYCDDGLCRFVDGRYAWEARESFMLAYVLDGSTISPTLSEQLEKKPERYRTRASPTPVADLAGNVACSLHDRVFPYPTRPNKSPGPIAVWHVWVPVDSCAGAISAG